MHAARCEVRARIGQLGANWYIWWWCADGRYQWTPIIPGDYTSDRLAASTAWAFGVNPDYMKGKAGAPATIR